MPLAGDVSGASWPRRLPPQVKIVAAVATILVIVLTPPRPPWVFLGYALILAAVVQSSGVGWRTVFSRMRVEVPFVAFAVLLPFIATGPEVTLGPLELSEPGLWAAWNILIKATLGIVVSILLAATTEAPDLVVGLQRLHVPDILVQILAAMVRYVSVVTGEWQRMSRARAARGFHGHGPRSWPVLARSLGTLFIRSYERGERVHLAMLSRGYTGRLPAAGTAAATSADWSVALVLPLTVLAVAALSWWVAR